MVSVPLATVTRPTTCDAPVGVVLKVSLEQEVWDSVRGHEVRDLVNPERRVSTGHCGLKRRKCQQRLGE